MSVLTLVNALIGEARNVRKTQRWYDRVKNGPGRDACEEMRDDLWVVLTDCKYFPDGEMVSAFCDAFQALMETAKPARKKR